MTDADFLRAAFKSLDVNATFTAATLMLRDDSQLHFCHRVDERTVKATGHGDQTDAAKVLAKIVRFRLNARHLDIQFADGSRWEALLGAS
jgi:hypothetical protein